jgi:hypothetical protein
MKQCHQRVTPCRTAAPNQPCGKLRTKRFGAGILQRAPFVLQVCNLHQKYSILDNGNFSGPGKIEINETLTAVVPYNANCTVSLVQSTIAM